MNRQIAHAGGVRRSLGRVFALPAGIAVLSLAGLITALLGGGLFDLFAWLALGAPVAAFFWAMRTRRR